ncbi:MAG: NRDE family protein [Phycisphaeraceae bacterium]|nr:NRDE family protein [Phycisphaeraceae bacterium]
MCTVTVVAPRFRRAAGSAREHSPLLRLVCNRDERRTRPAATPPIVITAGPRSALAPIDPQSGGTWIGVNDSGLIATLLNANPSPGIPASAPRSRGELVPLALAESSISEALTSLHSIDPAAYPPFSLFIAARGESAVLTSDSRTLRISSRAPLGRPLMLTSSSLGDHMVEPRRRRLFESIVARADDPSAAQDRFHTHTWPTRPHLSVLMSRPDARTVSRTVIELWDHSASLDYSPIPEDASTPLVTTRSALPLKRARVAG